MTIDWITQVAATLSRPADHPLVVRLVGLLDSLAAGRLTDDQAQIMLETDPALAPARTQVSFQGASIECGPECERIRANFRFAHQQQRRWVMSDHQASIH